MKLRYTSILCALCIMLLSWQNISYAQQTPALDEYRLGTGDSLKITVYDEPDLSGSFEVDGSGFVSIPLLGKLKAKSLTPSELEKKLLALYKDGYLIRPRINVEVENFRHFFIMGEVKNPGSYPYVSDLNTINAVALAGGYTLRAKKGSVIIMRKVEDSNEVKEMKAKDGERILPGDTIRVEERFF